jgi:hypothetical protein
MRRDFADCSPLLRIRRVKPLLALLTCLASAAGLSHAARAPAATPAPHWKITADAWPTNFKPGEKGDVYAVYATNDGSQPTNGSTITVKVTLPKGVTATGLNCETRGVGSSEPFNGNITSDLATLTCTYERVEATGPFPESPGKLYPRSFLKIFVTVDVPETPVEPVEKFATVAGGGGPSAWAGDPTKINQAPASFGLSRLSTDITDVSGNPDTQAGSHPFEMTTSLAFNSSFLDNGEPISLINPKDIEVSLPPGLLGDPGAVPNCSQATVQSGGFADCPAGTQVGQLLVAVDGESLQTVPVYNVEPPPGQPAELGIGVSQFIHVPMFFRVRGNGDYGLTAKLSNLPEAGAIRESVLSLWGVPADPAHNSQRQGSGCFSGCASNAPLRPFLRLPTSCPAEGVPGISLLSDSWQSPGRRDENESADLSDPNWASIRSSLPSLTGCKQLSFAPSIAVAPEITQAEAPSGYTVDLRVPQTSDPNVLATPDLKRAVVALPAGTIVSPSAAGGLEGCSDEQFALRSRSPANCAGASQVGRLKISTPLLSKPLEGQVFVGKPNCGVGGICTPRDAQEGRMIRVFLQAQGSGVIVKLQGTVSVSQITVSQGTRQLTTTGQLTTTFDNNPQLPFSELELVLNGGSRAPLANPTACGHAETVAELSPWSAPATPFTTSSLFEVSGCPSQIPFAPEFSAGTTSNQAASFSPFAATVSRPDGNQTLSGISVQTPPGLLGMLSRVQLCGEPQAAQGACAAASQIGHVTSAAGPGPDPVYLPQAGRPQDPVYLTGPYKGAPFGLSIVAPAEAGPFNLGTVVVRAAISVDPHTAQITVKSDPLPEQLDGIPLQIRIVSAVIDRAGFIFNPTNCQPLSVGGTITSTQGASAALWSRFQTANCASLPFKPSFRVSTQGNGTFGGGAKGKGASLDVKVSESRGEAAIGKVDVQLPLALPSRLTTLQQACKEAQFAANPAGCPPGSNVGFAKATTPVLKVPLTGPAYLVSHGGAAFPDLVVVLQGNERGGHIRIDLTGHTNIKKGITYSNFDSVPDAPISSFELTLPEGPHSALAAIKNLCALKKTITVKSHGKHVKRTVPGPLTMPTTITGQNGAVIKQSTRIAVTGCTKPRAHKARKATAAARTMAFNINSNLRLIGRPGHVLNERGTFAGSQSGTIEIRFTSVTHTSGEATFAAYSSHGGSVSGRASTKGHVVGATVYFTGVMSITGGTGRWAHASGRGLRFSGVVDRHSFHATTHMQGTISV